MNRPAPRHHTIRLEGRFLKLDGEVQLRAGIQWTGGPKTETALPDIEKRFAAVVTAVDQSVSKRNIGGVPKEMSHWMSGVLTVALLAS
ncbi:MAG: hypothetical protein Kow006_09190 [Gammaproteobacteria bacterium]